MLADLKPNSEPPLATVALFDFDGTLTTRELMPDFMRFAVSRPRQWLGVLLAPMILGYKLGWVDGRVIRAVIVWLGFRGVPSERLQDLGLRFAKEVIPANLREAGMQRLNWHRQQGHRVVVVSGALAVYLRPWCEAQNLDLICSDLAVARGRLTGRYRGAQCVRQEKVRLAQRVIDAHPGAVVYAYGDTVEDDAMLAMANHPFRMMDGAFQAWVAPR